MMDVSNGENVDTGRSDAYVLAWTAYVRPTLTFLTSVVLGWAASFIAWQAAIPFLVIALTWYVLRVLQLRSVELFTDVAGVWVFRGVFPWSRGHYGVRWQDLEDAAMHTGLWAWLTKSYRVRVGHRFTKSNEIELGHVLHGDQAVIHINQRRQQEVQADIAGAIFEALEKCKRG